MCVLEVGNDRGPDEEVIFQAVGGKQDTPVSALVDKALTAFPGGLGAVGTKAGVTHNAAVARVVLTKSRLVCVRW